MRAIELVTLAAGPYLLSPPAIGEAVDALAMLQDPDVSQWNPAPSVVNLEAAVDWCRRGSDWTSGRHATWSIRSRHDDETATIAGAGTNQARLLGNISLFEIDADDQMVASIGYRTAPWARNLGVATFGVIAACRWALDVLGLERLELRHAIANAASCRVAKKAGFDLEGSMRAEYRDVSGRRWDSHLHGRLADGPGSAPVLGDIGRR